MKIAQITPGVLPIPPDGWGAVEKIIWEYSKNLRNLGHQVDVIYADQATQNDWDVVHVHMANLALVLRDKGIPYVFSHHDHHAFHYGTGSDVYKQNREAIIGSVFSFVHAKYLVDYFNVPGKIRYLGHGANLQDYNFEDRSPGIISGNTSLVMMANNGLAGNNSYDRKGFEPGVESARILGLPITILCKKEGNKPIIDRLKPYEKLTVIYDLNYQDSINELRKHHIFLNPSMLEAGHPNLTVAESISMGIPVVGTSESKIPGLRQIEVNNLRVEPLEISLRISEVIKSYSTLVLECEKHRGLLSWEVIVSKMLMDYTKHFGITQKKKLLDNYSADIKKLGHKSDSSGFFVRYNPAPFVYKAKKTRADVSVSFVDQKTESVVYKSIMGKAPRSWLTPPVSSDFFIPWRIIIKDGTHVIYQSDFSLENKHVLVTETSGASFEILGKLKMFSEFTKCFISIDSETKGSNFFTFSGNDTSLFYTIFSLRQIDDFFKSKEKLPKKIFLNFAPAALGDNLAFMPYASKYADQMQQKIYVKSSHSELFAGIYPNLEFVDDTDCTDFSLINYLFDEPLQKGFCSQLGLDYSEIQPVIRKSKGKHEKIKGPYVCFSVHSTAQAKNWNNSKGWEKLCSELKELGLTPVCIDRFRSFGISGHWNEIPNNCLDKTGGDLDFMISLIEGCEFFIGLSSGLSWLAHALGKKVVMISGVTTPNNEFTKDCIRIHRNDVCNSCFNNPSEHTFDSGNWLWCPVHQNTGKEFECTKRISAKHVIERIKEAGLIYKK